MLLALSWMAQLSLALVAVAVGGRVRSGWRRTNDRLFLVGGRGAQACSMALSGMQVAGVVIVAAVVCMNTGLVALGGPMFGFACVVLLACLSVVGLVLPNLEDPFFDPGYSDDHAVRMWRDESAANEDHREHGWPDAA